MSPSDSGSIRQGRGLRRFREDRTFEFNKFLIILWLFALVLQARDLHVHITGE